LNSPETLVFHKGQELYGLYQTRRCSTRLERLIVVEGYLDVVALAQAGIAGVVATLGTALSADHVRKLFQFVPQLVFCFDGDRAGYQAAWKALEQVIPLLDEVRAAYFLLLPPGEDPDTLVRKAGAADFEQRLAAALPVPEFILHHLTERHDPRQPEAQRRLLAAAQPLFRQLPVGPLREVLLSQMSQRLGMERAGLLAALIANDTPPAMVAARPPRPSAAMPSITRLAVQCLLHHPEWATTAELPPVCQTVTWEGLDLLQALLAALVVTPQPTITALITRWQDHAWGRIVAQLASTELPISGTQQEWLDLCQQLALLCAQQRVQHLAAKGLAALTADERNELQRLSQRSYGA
jgi:DNA primase